MGLDTVDLLIRIEEAFDITIPDDHAESIQTVGDLDEYVAARLEPARRSRCLSAAAFYHLRRSLTVHGGPSFGRIRPRTRTVELLDGDDRRASWEALGQQLGWRLPRLLRPAWLVSALHAAVSTLFLATLGVGLTRGLPLAFLAPLHALALALTAIFLFRLTEPLATCIPPPCASVGGLVEASLMPNFTAIRRQTGFPPPTVEVVAKIRAIIAELLGISPEEITDDARFVEDLGVG